MLSILGGVLPCTAQQIMYANLKELREEQGDTVEEVDLDDEENGLIILKVVHVDGEDQLSTLDSDEELELVYQQFMEALFADEEEDPS